MQELARFAALDLTSGHNRYAGSLLASFGLSVTGVSLPVVAGGIDAVFEDAGKDVWVAPDSAAIMDTASCADVVLVDEDTGARYGVGPDAIVAANPAAIVCAITPWGLHGPRSADPGSELTAQAASGFMWLVGYADRPPVPVPGNQSAYQAGAQAAMAVLAALLDRDHNGGGDVIDLSRQEAMCRAITYSKAWWAVAKKNLMRSHVTLTAGSLATRVIWKASDGYVCWRIGIGLQSDSRMLAVIDWMVSDLAFGQELREVKWGSLSTLELTAAQMEAWEAQFARFFETKTRQELFSGAMERNVLLVPLLRADELPLDPHVRARECFSRVETGAGCVSLPGFPVRCSGIEHAIRPPRIVSSAPDWRRRSAPVSAAGGRLPLAGVNILDFGWMVAGPVATGQLGALGAVVLKVETNVRLDSVRASTPFAGSPSRDRSGFFAMHNNNKQSIVLDLHKPRSRDVAARLVRWADAVCENFSAGTMERWGLGYDQLREWNDDIILVRSSTWGQDGPYAEVPCNGVILGGFAGLGELGGWPDRPPAVPVEPYTDMVSPWFAASGLIAALLQRQFSGRGAVLDVSQLESTLHFLGPDLARASLDGSPPRRMPFGCRPYPQGVFAAPGDEQWYALSAETHGQWAALCRTIPGLAGMESVVAGGLTDLEGFVFQSLARWFSLTDGTAALETLRREGVPVAKVAKPEDVFADPQLTYRGHFVEREHPSMKRYAYEMPSFRFRDRTINVERSPLIGEHTGHVLGGLLGYSADEIADLYAEGVLN